MSDGTALAMAALWAAVHNIRILTSRGLASPDDVNEVHGSITEALEALGSPRIQATVRNSFDSTFAEMHSIAKDRYGGFRKDQP